MLINGDLCHDFLVKEMKHKLSFDENKDFAEYRKELKAKYLITRRYIYTKLLPRAHAMEP